MGRDGGRFVMLGLGLAFIAGCSSNEPSANNERLPKVTHAKAEAPKDRDEKAVMAALRQLDACALVDPAAKVAGFPADAMRRARSPHRCEILREDGADEVEVILGDLLDAQRRSTSELLTIGGVKAYRSASEDSCFVDLPVSFRLAIKFYARKGSRSASSEMCAPAKGFAQYAVGRLADPDRVKPGQNTPMAEWDACQILTAGLGDNPEGLKIATNSSNSGVDSCGADKERPENASPAVRVELQYGRDPASETKYVRTVGGKPVRVYEESDYCNLAWSNGKVKSGEAGRTDQVVEVQARDCKGGEAITTAAMSRLRDAPPTAAKPQRPLTYRPDEPDIALPGACADFAPVTTARPCEPYVEITVPSGSQDVLRAAEADPNVNCAIAKEAVARHFGDKFKPVTSMGRCVFVEPTHSVELTIVAMPISIEMGDKPQNVAGHPAYTERRGNGSDLYIDHELGVSVGERGIVKFTGSFARKRGADREARIDDSLSSKLQPLATDVMTKYFAG